MRNEPLRGAPVAADQPPTECRNCPLRQIDLFLETAATPADHVQAMRSNMRTLAAGEALFHAGDPVTEAYTIYDGYSLTYRILPDGRRHIIRFLLRGDLLIPSGLRDGDVAWGNDALAVTEVSLCVFPIARLRRLFAESVEVARAVALAHAAEERMLEEHVTDLGRRQADERIARLLLELFFRMKARSLAQSSGCPLAFRQEQLADAVGLSAVHFSRVNTSLRAQGMPHVRQRRIEIPNLDRAMEAFGFSPAYLFPRPLL